MITANVRPQPAIPALAVLFVTITFAVFSHDPGTGRSALILLVPLGILVSCGLAIAAGFCSLFPQAAWILMAGWALRFVANGALPVYNRFALLAGMLACGLMIVVQCWRVLTGRFVPTIRVEN